MDQNVSPNYRNWLKMFTLIFIIGSLLLLIPLIIPDTKHRIATFEIIGLIIIPLLLFYARTNLSRRMWLINIPVLVLVWSFTYAMLHELSHLIGIIVVGDKIIDYHILPKFWEGDFNFNAGWVRSQLLNDWRDVIPGLFPYFRDIVLLIVGLLVLRSKKIHNSFLVGLIFILFCLSSLFDIVDNYFIGYIVGHGLGNDFLGTAMKIGDNWTNIIGILFAVIALSLCGWIIFIYKDFPNNKL
jgi:hypothetical protein